MPSIQSPPERQGSQAAPDETITYTIVVTNNGPSKAIGTMVTDYFPTILSGVTYTSSTTGTVSGNTAAGAEYTVR